MAGAEVAVGIVSDLWRFPVKSFGGERARRAFAGPFGLLGDRRHAVVDVTGEALTARRAHALLGFSARSGDAETGERVTVTTPAGLSVAWDDPALAGELTAALGREVALARSAMGVHDAAPVHIVTTASLAAGARWTADEPLDRRRFRANLVIETDDGEPFGEAAWLGATLDVGDEGPLLRVVSPTERCAVTTFDPDTLQRDNRVLAGLARERDNFFGVYATVVRPGWLAVGDPVRLVDEPAGRGA
jgi:uncharacterized protein